VGGEVPFALSYGVCISQLVRFVHISNNVTGFNDSNLLMTEKLLRQGNRFHKSLKTFTKLLLPL